MIEFESFLTTLKSDMMPLCSDMILVAKAVGMIGCLVAVGMVTIRSMADNEPINLWGYVKPLALAFCIISFNTLVIGTLDGIMGPVSRATSAMAASAETDYYERADRLDKEISRMPASPEVICHTSRIQGADKSIAEVDETEVPEEYYEEKARKDQLAEHEYKKNWLMKAIEYLLQVLSWAAKLIINVVGTFYLILLAILGPLAFAAACFPNLEGSFSSWLTRYITISLWLPIANLLTAVLSRANAMLCEKQLEEMSTSGTVDSILMLAMMVVGIFGYFSVPSIAGWIVQAGGSGSYSRNLTQAGKQMASKGLTKARGVIGGITRGKSPVTNASDFTK